MLRSLYDLKSLTIFTYCLHIACCSELLEILEQTTPFAIYRHSFYRQNASICLCKIKPVGRPTLLFHVQIMHCRLQHMSCMYSHICIALIYASPYNTHEIIFIAIHFIRYLQKQVVSLMSTVSRLKRFNSLHSWSWVSTSACICG